MNFVKRIGMKKARIAIVRKINARLEVTMF